MAGDSTSTAFGGAGPDRDQKKLLKLPPHLKDFHLLKSAFKKKIAHYKYFFPADTVRLLSLPLLLFSKK